MVILWLLLLHGVVSVRLICNNVDHNVSNVEVAIKNLQNFGLYPSKPCAFTHDGICHTAGHLSISSSSQYFCEFTMNKCIISDAGAIFQTFIDKESIGSQVLFDHESMSGVAKPNYLPLIANNWNKGIFKAGNRFNFSEPLTEIKGIVVPLRMPWDDCFNHLSFEVLPLIGAVHTFYKQLWSQLYFHCSTYSGAMLSLLGVPSSQLIVQQSILAKKVILPWIPHWIPIQSSSMKGISQVICDTIRTNLLSKQIDVAVLKIINPLKMFCPTHPKVSMEALLSPTDPYRYIVYNSRSGQLRDVYKQDKILSMISKYINKSKYRLVVVGSSKGYNDIERLHASWQRFAKVYSKAIVMMGPHGAAFNNMIFTPSDCHMIEFNYLPEDKFNIGGTVVRSYFLSAHHTMGGSGKFYNIQPNNATSNNPKDIYWDSFMRISQRDIIKTLIQINKDIPKHDLLIDHINVMDVPVLSLNDLNWEPPSNVSRPVRSKGLSLGAKAQLERARVKANKN